MQRRMLEGYVIQVDGKRGAYGVVFPDLPGCTAMGETVDMALANASIALGDWTELMTKAGHVIHHPQD